VDLTSLDFVSPVFSLLPANRARHVALRSGRAMKRPQFIRIIGISLRMARAAAKDGQPKLAWFYMVDAKSMHDAMHNYDWGAMEYRT
jgi:hypothetical protein